jgi:hypothetical protein
MLPQFRGGQLRLNVEYTMQDVERAREAQRIQGIIEPHQTGFCWHGA